MSGFGYTRPANSYINSFPDGLFNCSRVRDPVLGNTSIPEADFGVLKVYVQNFEEGIGFEEAGDAVNELRR